MKTPILILTVCATLLAAPVQAANCYADYKAKQDRPLRLHYGVAQVNGQCNASAAARELTPRLARGNWKLLKIISVFGPEGLDRRKGNAGPNYLRY